MPRTPQKAGAQVRVNEDTIKILRKLAKKTGRSQPSILETLIEMAEVHDLLREDWEDRLNAALEKGMWWLQRKKHLESKEKCQGLRAADQKWKCIQGRPNQTPMIRNLAEDRDDALNLCEGCTETLQPILKNYELQEKIQQLENNLNVAAGVTFKAPVCNRGSVLTAEGTEFRGCPKRPSAKTVSVAKFCKVLSDGLPCALYAEIPISVADRESQVNMDL